MKFFLQFKSGFALQINITVVFICMFFVSFAQPATGDYRTRTAASGSWTGTNIWQRFAGGSWGNVSTSPTSADGAIEVQGDASLTISAALNVDQLTINGTVTYNNASNGNNRDFELNNSSGTDMIVNGTFIFAATGNRANFTISSGATWSVSSGGTYVHNSVRVVTTPLDAATLNSNSNFVYRGSSSLNPSVSVSGRTYGNLKFESTSGALTVTPTGSGTLTVQGNLSIGGTGAGTTSLNMSSFTGTLNVSGTSTVVAGSTLTTPNAVYTATGDMTVNGTLTFSNNITAGGNWVQGSAGMHNNSTCTVTFNSASTQTITKTGGGSVTFNNITVNKTGGTLTLGSNTNVAAAGTLALTTGNAVIGNNTLTAAVITRTSGSLQGSNTSNLTITGTGSNLFFDNSGSNNVLKNFTLNTGATATLGNALNITGYDGNSSEGVLTVTGTATLTTGGFLTIKSNVNGTARIAAGRTSGGYISGNVTVERFIPQNSSKGWRLLASNTSGQTINAAWQEGVSGSLLNPNPGFGFKITSSGPSLAAVQALGFDTLSLGKSIFKYVQSLDMLDFVPNTNNTQLSSEHGYFVFIRGDRSAGQFGGGAPLTSTVLRSKGTLFQGDQPAVNVSSGQYAVVRNPYASRIDVRQIIRTGGVVAAFQVWDPKLTGAFGGGAFQTLTRNTLNGNYEISPGGGSYGVNGSVQNYIESGAAFYVQATGSNGSVQVTEACKTAGSLLSSFRPASPLAVPVRVLFNIYANNPSSTDMVDGGFIDFDEAYSNNVDVFDVRKNQNFNENFAIERNSTELVVERRQPVAAADTVSFKMYNLRRINYTLHIETSGFDTLLHTAVLHDSYTGTETVLSLSALNAYTFTVNTSAASVAAGRFKILLRRAGVVPVTFISVKATATKRSAAIQWRVAAETNISHYEVEKSADGNRFSHKASVTASGNNMYNWMDETTAAGTHFYRIKAVDVNGQFTYSNVIKAVVQDVQQGITVFPNPVLNNELSISFKLQAKGIYDVNLVNVYGQVIFKTALQHDGIANNYKVKLPSYVKAGRFELVLSDQEGQSQKISIIHMPAH